MAKITNLYTGLSLEVRFVGYVHEWVHYYFFPRWRGYPVFNTDIIKLAFRGRRLPKGALAVDDFGCDSLMKTIRSVLDSGMPDWWTPCEPDVTITMLPSHWHDDAATLRGMAAADERVLESARRLRAAIAKPKLPRDEFELQLALDAHAMEMKGEFLGDALLFRMYAERQQWEKFHADLGGEYEIFCQRHGIVRSVNATSKQPEL